MDMIPPAMRHPGFNPGLDEHVALVTHVNDQIGLALQDLVVEKVFWVH